MESRQSFVVYHKWFDAIGEVALSESEQFALLKAIVRYGLSGETPKEEMSGQCRMAFAFIRRDIDNNASKYDDVREKRRAAGRARWRDAPGLAQTVRDGETAQSDPRIEMLNPNSQSNPAVEKTDENSQNNPAVEKADENSQNSPAVEKATETTHAPAPESAGAVSGDISTEAAAITEQTAESGDTEAATGRQRGRPEKLQYAENVRMSEQEHATLVNLYGTEAVAWMVEKLSNYKAANGKAYKSDYRAILSWVVNAWQENLRKNRSYGASREIGEADAKRERDADFAAFVANELTAGK